MAPEASVFAVEPRQSGGRAGSAEPRPLRVKRGGDEPVRGRASKRLRGEGARPQAGRQAGREARSDVSAASATSASTGAAAGSGAGVEKKGPADLLGHLPGPQVPGALVLPGARATEQREHRVHGLRAAL